MRIVILINPKVQVECYKNADKYAEASMGFSAPLKNAEDNEGLIKALREFANMLEAPTLIDKEIQ